MRGSPRSELGQALDELLGDPAPHASAKMRVHRGITRRIDRSAQRRRHAGRFAAVAAVGAVAAGAIAITLSARSDTRAPGADETARSGAVLGPGTLELPSRARVVIYPGADVRLLGDDAHGTRLHLARGVVLAHVEPRPAGSRFVISVPNASVEVLGTTFAVGVSDAGAVQVQGREGTVAVVTRAARTLVRAGERWPNEAALLVTSDEGWRAVSTIGAPSPVVEASAAAPVVDASSPAPAVVNEPTAAAGTRAKRAPSPFRIAKRLEEDGDITAAVAAYENVANAHTPESEDALYALGRIQLHRQRDSGAALETFFAYRKRYAKGRYARAVDVHVLDVAIANRDSDLIEQEAARFLAEHAGDPRAIRFRTARASVRAARGDCIAARSDVAGLPYTAIPSNVLQRCP